MLILISVYEIKTRFTLVGWDLYHIPSVFKYKNGFNCIIYICKNIVRAKH